MTHTIPESKTQAREAAGRVAGKAREALSSAKSAVHDRMEALSDRTRMARDWAGEKVEAARDLPYEMADRGADYIRARPYTMLGVALAVGYLLGRLLSDDVRSAMHEDPDRD